MTIKFVALVLTITFAAAAHLNSSSIAVCDSSTDSGSWPFSVSEGMWYSCASSSGGTNDMGNVPTQCVDDPASVRIEVTTGAAECLVAYADQCKIPMHDFVSLDYDFAIDSCMGIWAAPLWMTPDTWQWGAGSGEIDSSEFCPRDSLYLNFAGGGHQVSMDEFSIDGSEGHITVRKDEVGIVTIAACSAGEAAANYPIQCDAPIYTDCDDCLDSGNTYSCWCNADADNIYGSGGCTTGTDCEWTLVSDIWNGVTGDDGYYGCMTEVPAIGLEADQPNYDSACKMSVSAITLRGGGPNQSLQWGDGSPSSCAVLTTDPGDDDSQDDSLAEDDSLGDDGAAVDDNSQYTDYAGYNCYTGNGGTPVDPTDNPTSSAATITECQKLCDGCSTCTAFTRESVESGQCWLRSSVTISECISGTGYDTWAT